MTTILPIDANNNTIPALRLKDGGAQFIAATASSARNTQAFGSETRIISLYATDAVYLRFGNSNVTATAADHFFPKDTYYDIAIGGYGVDHTPYVSVLAAGGDCTLYISEKE